MPPSTTPRVVAGDAIRLIATAMLLVLLAATGAAGCDTCTSHDRFPDFGAGATIGAARSGAWSAASTWDRGRVPGTGDVVVVPAGIVVSYDVAAAARLRAVAIHGVLRFRADADTRLLVGDLLVHADGALEIGTEAEPIAATARASVVFADQAIDVRADPQQYGTGLIALGRVRVHGQPRTAFMRFAAEPHAGDTVLRFARPVSGWRPSDTLLLTDSRQLQYAEHFPRVNHAERAIVAAVAPDGMSVSLAAPLAWDHPGARTADDAVDILPHVANLARNVEFSSEDPAGTTGHTLYSHRADVDVRHAGFIRLGRTRNAPLDSTVLDAAGVPTRIGTNQVGRYPVHFHHLIGPAATPASGWQYAFVGNVIDGGDADHDRKWGMAIHNAHHGLIADNVVYNAMGWGIGTEEGQETGNLISGNLVARVHGYGDARDSATAGTEGNGFWLRGTGHRVRGNVASDCQMHGFVWYAAIADVMRVPGWPGADPGQPGQHVEARLAAMPIREFADNEAYRMDHIGLSLWNLSSGVTEAEPVGRNRISGFTAWHVHRHGCFPYPANNLTFERCRFRGARRDLPYTDDGKTGIFFGDYMTPNVLITDCDFENLHVGVILPAKAGDARDPDAASGLVRIERSRFRCYQGVVGSTMFGVTGGGAGLSPRLAEVRDCEFLRVPMADRPGDPPFALGLLASPGERTNATVIQRDELHAFGCRFAGGAPEDLRVYYAEQRAEAILPASEPGLTGCPEAGLTNRQAFDRYGIAYAGSVAPAAAAPRAYFAGLVGPAAPEARLVVDVGANQMVSLDGTAMLSGFVRAHGIAAGATITWSTVSGPAAALVADPASLTTTARFAAPGVYVLRLTANGGGATAWNELGVTVLQRGAAPPNTAPSLAGPGDVVLDEDHASAVLAIAIGDAESGAATLALTASADDATLLPSSSLLVGGTGGARTIVIRPAADRSGTARVTLRASDGIAATMATFTVTVRPVNDRPVAAGLSASTAAGVPVSVTAPVSDADGDPLTVRIVAPPAHGRLAVSGSTLTYTPEAGFVGDDGFAFAAADATLESAPAMATVSVLAASPDGAGSGTAEDPGGDGGVGCGFGGAAAVIGLVALLAGRRQRPLRSGAPTDAVGP